MNVPVFMTDARFWTAVFDVVVIVITSFRPELQDKLDTIVPLLVIITVAVFGGKIVDNVAKAWVARAYAQAGRALPDEAKKLVNF